MLHLTNHTPPFYALLVFLGNCWVKCVSTNISKKFGLSESREFVKTPDICHCREQLIRCAHSKPNRLCFPATARSRSPSWILRRETWPLNEFPYAALALAKPHPAVPLPLARCNDGPAISLAPAVGFEPTTNRLIPTAS